MGTLHRDKWCPNCGGNIFDKDRINGADTGDLKCLGCGEVAWNSFFSGAFPAQTCKNEACGHRIPKKHGHTITMVKGFSAELKKGFIRCPKCKGRHKAVNVRITESGPGTGTFYGEFGDYDPDPS